MIMAPIKSYQWKVVLRRERERAFPQMSKESTEQQPRKESSVSPGEIKLLGNVQYVDLQSYKKLRWTYSISLEYSKNHPQRIYEIMQKLFFLL